MNLKRISAILCTLIILTLRSAAQAPTYNFTFTTNTVTEANATVVAGYVKTNIAPLTDDSVIIAHISGPSRAWRADVVSQTVVHFSALQDSAAFMITLHDDTFPESPDHMVFNLQTYGTFDTIGVNNQLDVTLIDNDLPATISYVMDTDSVFMHDGLIYLCETINNPNPFYVRFLTRNYDYWSNIGLTAYPGYSYNYYPDTIYAPPGISTICQPVYLSADTVTSPVNRTFLVKLVNVDDNILVDSTILVIIWNDNIYNPPSVSFDISNMTVIKDTAVLIGIPFTTVYSNHSPLSFQVDTYQFSSTASFQNAAAYHVSWLGNYYSHSTGTWRDTMWITVLNNHLIFDTSTIVFHFKGVTLNTSPDTLYTLTIIDTGSLIISFKGAGFAHLKGDSIGYVEVYTSAPVKYPVTADVTYLNGNAVMGTDFLWRDTTVTFAANIFDTVKLPVIMLKNHIHDGNKQVNFLLSNAVAPNIKYDIIQYSYVIIDDDSTAAFPAGILNVDNSDLIKVYPNPFSSAINIHSTFDNYQVTLTNILGEKIIDLPGQSGDIQVNPGDLPQGTYLIRISDSDKSYVKVITKM
ncbi:MAG: hypothetical protein JWO03_377 [Bacteroidetes bacterium]|nr:hypothetical protein [Bacteroidota bacterium]